MPVYDRLADYYDPALAPFERWFLSRWRAEMMAALPADGRLLELGAGTGLNFSYYPPEARGVATDLSGAMLARARDKSAGPTAVSLLRSRAEQLPFAEDSFDAACATLLFCSVASPPDAFRELRRVVRSGGTIALLEHVRPPGFLLGPLFDFLNLLTVPLFEDHFNRQTIEEARRAGLRVERVRGYARGIVQMIVCRV